MVLTKFRLIVSTLKMINISFCKTIHTCRRNVLHTLYNFHILELSFSEIFLISNDSGWNSFSAVQRNKRIIIYHQVCITLIFFYFRQIGIWKTHLLELLLIIPLQGENGKHFWQTCSV